MLYVDDTHGFGLVGERDPAGTSPYGRRGNGVVRHLAAFASGPLLLVVPAGAGVREAALLLLLGSTVPVPVAAVIAVVSRLLFAAGDLAWSGVAVVAARRPLRPPGPPQPPPA